MTARMRDGATTDDYRNALSGEGEFMSLGYEWADKPHRLVYDLCGEVDHLRGLLAAYVADEDRFNKGSGEPYGSISTETGMLARAALKRN